MIARPTPLFGAHGSSTGNVSAAGIGLGIFQAVAASAHMIVARHLKDEDTNVCLLYLSSIHALSSIAGSIILRAFQLPRSWAVAGLLAATCMCAYGKQWTITTGLQRVGAILGTAVSYLTIVWGLLLGFLVFHEIPTALSISGACLISSSTMILALTASLSKASSSSLHAAWESCSQGAISILCCWQKRKRGYQALDTEQLQGMELQ